MPCWPLSLPPPAAPTSPSHLHRSLLPIAVNLDGELQSRSPSPAFAGHHVHHHAIPHRQVAITPSLSIYHHCDCSPSPSRLRRPSPSIATKEPSRHPLPSRSRSAVHCCRAAPSITVEEPSIAVNPSTAFKSLSLRPLMPIAVESLLCRPSSSHRAIHHR